MILENEKGNYRFLKGGPAFSEAVVADAGYRIVHVTLLQPPAIPDGFDFIAAYLKKAGRPVNAVCAIQLRLPKPLSPDGFAVFNTSLYRPALEKYDLLVDGVSPMTRSNLAIELNPPSDPILYGFGYTLPGEQSGTARDFVLAGAADLDKDRNVIRAGETSDEAMREKALFEMNDLSERLNELGLAWQDCTTVNVYTVHNVMPYLVEGILKPIGRAQMEGVKWYFMRPPILGLEMEIDARRTMQEIYIG